MTMKKTFLHQMICAMVTLAAVAASGTSSAADVTKSFANTRTIKINDLCADPNVERCANLADFYPIREANVIIPSKAASPYGNAVRVPENAFPAGSKIKDINVTLHGVTHTNLDDVDVLLIAPDGRYVMLMSNVNSSGVTANSVANLTFIFDDSAVLPLPNSNRNDGKLTSSTTSELASIVYDEWINVWTDPTPRRYKPTDYDPANPLSVDDLDYFPAPAPAGMVTPRTIVDSSSAEMAAKKLVTSGPQLSTFNGMAPTGDWRLYVVDDFFWYDGVIQGGWSMEITVGD